MEKNTLFARVNLTHYAHVKVEKRREKEAKPTLAQIKMLVCVSPLPASEIKFSGMLAVGHWKANGSNRNRRQETLFYGILSSRYTEEIHSRKALLGSRKKIWPTRQWSNGNKILLRKRRHFKPHSVKAML